MLGWFADEDSIRSIEEAVEVFIELIFIEAFEGFAIFLTVVGETVDSGLDSFGLGVTLVDERDSVL